MKQGKLVKLHPRELLQLQGVRWGRRWVPNPCLFIGCSESKVFDSCGCDAKMVGLGDEVKGACGSHRVLKLNYVCFVGL